MSIRFVFFSFSSILNYKNKEKRGINYAKITKFPFPKLHGGGRLNSPKLLVLKHFKGCLSALNTGVKEIYTPTQITPINTRYLLLPNTNINADFFLPQNTTINKYQTFNLPQQNNNLKVSFSLLNSPQHNKNLIKIFSATPCAFLAFPKEVHLNAY